MKKLDVVGEWKFTDELNQLQKMEFSVVNDEYHRAWTTLRKLVVVEFFKRFEGYITRVTYRSDRIDLVIVETARELGYTIFSKNNSRRVEYTNTAADVIANDILAGTGWSLGEDFPTTTCNIKFEYQNRYNALKRLAEYLNADLWFAERKVYMGIKGKTIDDILDVRIDTDPEFSDETFYNRIYILGDKTPSGQLEVVVEDPDSQAEYGEIREMVYVDTSLTNVDWMQQLGSLLLAEASEPSKDIEGTVPYSTAVKYELKSGDIIRIAEPLKNVQGFYRITKIEGTPTEYRLTLSKVLTPQTRMRQMTLTQRVSELQRAVESLQITD